MADMTFGSGSVDRQRTARELTTSPAKNRSEIIDSVADAGCHAANQRAPAFGMMTVQRDTLAIDRHRRMRLDNFVDSVRSTIRIFFWTVHEVMQACNLFTIDAVGFRTGDHSPAVRGFITDHDHL